MAKRNKKGPSTGKIVFHVVLGFLTAGIWWIILGVRYLLTK